MNHMFGIYVISFPYFTKKIKYKLFYNRINIVKTYEISTHCGYQRATCTCMYSSCVKPLSI